MINRELIRLKAVQLVYAYYQNQGKTLDVAEKEFTFALDKAYELYLYLLNLLVEIKHVAERKDAVRLAREQRTGNATHGVVPDHQFANNQFLVKLSQNAELIDYQENRKGTWHEEDAFAKKLYAQIAESEIFQLYISKEDFSYEADQELLRKIYKTLIVDNEDFTLYLEDHSLYWNDDKYIIDSFVLKTIKRINADSKPKDKLLPPYTDSEDQDFANRLFRAAIERGDELREIIRHGTKNWEFNRLAFMDVVIMQIALAEILTFDAIPLSVTFNEYLDIAKIYSTPKSSSYINGMLDGIVKKLSREGRTTKVRTTKARRPDSQVQDFSQEQ